jgi:hypothetical protein
MSVTFFLFPFVCAFSFQVRWVESSQEHLQTLVKTWQTRFHLSVLTSVDLVEKEAAGRQQTLTSGIVTR